MPAKSVFSQHPQAFLSAIEQMANHVMVTDRDGRIVYVNPAFEKTTGYKKEEVIGQNPRILKSGLQTREYYERLWKDILAGHVFESVVVNKKKNGDFYYASQTISPIRDDSGQLIYFISVWEDITRHLLQEKQIRSLSEVLEFEKYKLEQLSGFDEQLAKFKNLHKLVDFVVHKTSEILEARKCSLMLADIEEKHLFVKGAVGLDDCYVVNNPIVIGEGISGQVAKSREGVLVADIHDTPLVQRKNRERYASRSFMSVPILLGQQLLGVLNVSDKLSRQADIFNDLDFKILKLIARQAAFAIENAKLYRHLEYLAFMDPVTHLHNRRYLMETLEHEICRAKQSASPLYLMMIDIDHFQAFNLEHGQAAGDKLLRHVGKILRDHLRKLDVVCRYSVDSFAVIIPHTDEAGAMAAGAKIKGIVESETGSSISVGIAKYHEGSKIYDFIRRSSFALLESQKDFSHRIVSYL